MSCSAANNSSATEVVNDPITVLVPTTENSVNMTDLTENQKYVLKNEIISAEREQAYIAVCSATEEDLKIEETIENLSSLSTEELVNTYKKYAQFLVEAQSNKMAAHNVAEWARALGYDENSTTIITAKADWQTYEEISQVSTKICQKIKEIIKTRQQAEYPVATEVWYYLKNKGFSDYAAAGIIGNMMVECGGLTLNLNYSASNSSYYGLCQWSKTYYPGVIGTSTTAQMDFLMSNIKYEIDTYGKNYSSSMNYNGFINVTSASEAALVFAKSYERCGSASYANRQSCAEVAYNYYANKI